MARLEFVVPAEDVATFLRLLVAVLTPHCGRCCVDVGVDPLAAAAPAVPAVVLVLDFVLMSLAMTDEGPRFGVCDCVVEALLAPLAAPGTLRDAVLVAPPPARFRGGLSGLDWVRLGVDD